MESLIRVVCLQEKGRFEGGLIEDMLWNQTQVTQFGRSASLDLSKCGCHELGLQELLRR